MSGYLILEQDPGWFKWLLCLEMGAELESQKRIFQKEAQLVIPVVAVQSDPPLFPNPWFFFSWSLTWELASMVKNGHVACFISQNILLKLCRIKCVFLDVLEFEQNIVESGWLASVTVFSRKLLKTIDLSRIYAIQDAAPSIA